MNLKNELIKTIALITTLVHLVCAIFKFDPSHLFKILKFY